MIPFYKIIIMFYILHKTIQNHVFTLMPFIVFAQTGFGIRVSDLQLGENVHGNKGKSINYYTKFSNTK